MFKSKLDKFIVKRAAALLILLTAAELLFLKSNRWFVLEGLLAGAFISIGRLSSNEWILKKTLKSNGGQAVAGSIVAFILSYLVLISVITFIYFLNVWAFYGLITGILVVPIIIMMNSITEMFGITKNRFE